MMRIPLLSVIILAMTSTTALSHEVGRVTTVQENYRTEVVRSVIPGPCFTERVPVYSGGNAVSGAIIGGIIGNQIGNGSGRDAATVLGALIGAESAGRQRIVGWQEVRRCDDTISEQHLTVKDGYRVFYSVNGITYSFYTHERFFVGDRIIHR
jgi:uncharacterized protein YcfJ